MPPHNIPVVLSAKNRFGQPRWNWLYAERSLGKCAVVYFSGQNNRGRELAEVNWAAAARSFSAAKLSLQTFPLELRAHAFAVYVGHVVAPAAFHRSDGLTQCDWCSQSSLSFSLHHVGMQTIWSLPAKAAEKFTAGESWKAECGKIYWVKPSGALVHGGGVNVRWRLHAGGSSCFFMPQLLHAADLQLSLSLSLSLTLSLSLSLSWNWLEAARSNSPCQPTAQKMSISPTIFGPKGKRRAFCALSISLAWPLLTHWKNYINIIAILYIPIYI